MTRSLIELKARQFGSIGWPMSFRYPPVLISHPPRTGVTGMCYHVQHFFKMWIEGIWIQVLMLAQQTAAKPSSQPWDSVLKLIMGSGKTVRNAFLSGKFTGKCLS